MTGGSISGNSAKNGGGIYRSGGNFSMTGGTISNNRANNSGGGIYSRDSGSTAISGGFISDNSAGDGNGGGGIYHSGGSFTMTGGTISGNSAGYGGGVCIEANFSLSGGLITNNSAFKKGGGVYHNGGTFRISAAPTISGNTKDTVANNVHLESDKLIVIDGALTNTIPIGVTMQTIGTFTSGLDGKGMTANFASDNADYVVSLNGSEAMLSKLTYYDVSIAADITGGTVLSNKNKALLNETVTLTLTPADASYKLAGVTVTETENPSKSIFVKCDGFMSNTATFDMPAAAVTVSATFTTDWTADGGLYVNMPAESTATVEMPAGVSSFKLYDDGGADGNYSQYCRSAIILKAPDDCVLQLTGTITADVGDKLIVYDGATRSAPEILNTMSGSDGGTTDIGRVIITGQNMLIAFDSYYGHPYSGLDLTVTVVDKTAEHIIVIADVEGGSASASPASAAVSAEVTLTAAPDTANGYMLNDISVAGSSGSVDVTGGTWYTGNTAAFRMPGEAVTVMPTFTKSRTAEGLFVNMPKSGVKTVTIPADVSSFKIYDDGGATGNYSPYTNETLILIAPEGHLIQLSGDLQTCGHSTSALTVYDGMETTDTKLIDAFTQSIWTSIPTVTGSGKNMRLYLETDAHNDTGFDLTAKVGHTVTAATGLNGGSISADKTFASDGETVTLTVTPDTGYIITSVSYNDGSDHVIEAVADVYSFVISADTNANNITVTASFGKPIYGENITVSQISALTYTGSPLTPAVTVKDGGIILTQETDYRVAYDNNVNAGTATVTITGIGNYTGIRTETFTISPKPMTATASNLTPVYDGQAHGVSVTVSDPASGYTIMYGNADGIYDLNESPTITNVSDGGKIVYFKVTAPNYTDYTGSATITISPAAVKVAADNKTKTEGEDDPALTATVTGLIGSDTVNYTLSREAGEEEGSYAITAGGEAVQGNYTVTYQSGTFTITAKPDPDPEPDPDPDPDLDPDPDPDPETATNTNIVPKPVTPSVPSNPGTGEQNKPEEKTVTENKVDGSKTETKTNADGTMDTKTTAQDGSTGEVKTNAEGETVSAEATVSEKAVEDAAKAGENIKVQVEVKAADSAEKAAPVTVTLPKTEKPVRVEIPVENVTASTVAVIVFDDGREEIVKTSTNSETGVKLTLSGSATVKIVENAKAFGDVKADDWFASSVAWAASHEIMNGVGGGKFEPNAKTSRGMIAQLLFNLDGAEASGDTAAFNDVAADDWFADAVTWMTVSGIAKGRGDSFGANDSVSREDLAVILYNYAQFKGYDVSAQGDVSAFGDADGVSDYAKDAIAWAVGTGLINGTTDASGGLILDAQGSATRGQVAAIMQRFCEKVAK
jgi:hypothetical protein